MEVVNESLRNKIRELENKIKQNNENAMQVVDYSSQSKIRDLEDEIRETTELLNQAKIKLQESKSQKIELEKQNHDMNLKIEDLEKELRSLKREESERFYRKVKKLQAIYDQRLKYKKSRITAEIESRLKSTDNIVQDLVQQRDELRQKLSNEQKRNADKESQIKQLESMQVKQLESIRDLCKQKQDELKKKVTHEIHLNNEVLRKTEIAMEELKKELAESKEKIENLTSSQTLQNSKYQLKIQTLESTIQDLMIDRNGLKSKLVETGNQLQARPYFRETIYNPKSTKEIETLKAKINNLQKDLEKSKKENSSLKGVQTKAKNKTKELEEKIEKIWEEMKNSESGSIYNHVIIDLRILFRQ